MSTEVQKQFTTKDLFSQKNIKAKFEEMMGKKAQGFITSVLQIVANNKDLQNADPMSVYNAAAVAATLDLPLNNNLGFAYIIAYSERQPDGSYKQVAQFQMGYKGFIQLAQRSGQFKTISAAPIYEGQLVEENPLTGYLFDFTKKKSETQIGFAAYFQLLNGFEKTLFFTVDQLKAHGLKYSKSYANPKSKAYSRWELDFDAMAIKTVLKLLIAKYGPMSIEMNKAVLADQGVIRNSEATEITYVDNEEPQIDKAQERIMLMIEDAKTPEDLDKIGQQVDMGLQPNGIFDAFEMKKEVLKSKAKK
jgi:recombination protein RecT